MGNKKRALVSGVTGQDASYLVEFLLDKGYEVYGMYRRGSTDGHFERIEHLAGKINLVCGDLTDLGSLERIFSEVKPDEIYNLAAQSQVGVSFTNEMYTYETNWLGVERILECMKKHVPNAKLYQASSSELYGEVLETPQSEKTPFNPVSPYGRAKLKAHKAIERERANGLFACAGILFNHTGPNRGLEFITRKISDGIARMKIGLPQRVTGKDYIEIGNLEAKRDFGYSKDYIEAMYLMLQQDKPQDYVIATGETHTIRELVEVAMKEVGIDLKWEGKGLYEKGYDQNGKLIIAINEKYFRPNEVHLLLGDASKAKKELGWEPKTKFKELIKIMVKADLERYEPKKEKYTDPFREKKF